VELLSSDDLSTIYILRQAGQLQGDIDIYRYDVMGEKLMFVTHIEADGARRHFEVNSDGRYLYFIAASVAGLPAGGVELKTEGASGEGQTSQRFATTTPKLLCNAYRALPAMIQSRFLFHGAGNFQSKPKPKPRAKKRCGKRSKRGCKVTNKRRTHRSKGAHKRPGSKVTGVARHGGSKGRTAR
jgi:hypothetical protein